MATSTKRDEVIGVRMSAEEVRMLRALAESDGISVSDLLRMLLRRDWIARYGQLGPALRKKVAP